jgi:peptide-methionine (S)-S-oxide reductase
MPRFGFRSVLALVVAVPLVAAMTFRSSSRAVVIPDLAVRPDAVRPTGLQTAVFAGGCFWGIEAVFEHIKGVTNAVSGFAGGSKENAEYETVSTGSTGHAESVKVTFDPAVVTYAQLLKVFFSVAHDPTQLNRQGPDVGSQYRSAIFYVDEEQAREARAYIDQLTKARTFSRPIVTQVAPLKGFFVAEAYHQDYMQHHPNDMYIVINDRPKVEHLKEQFPQLYREVGDK